ncbi:methyltransferase domain-containing protein [Phage DSL-LC06]|nr:methyltransferase domain-containing protein [Phage DSL-LC06]
MKDRTHYHNWHQQFPQGGQGKQWFELIEPIQRLQPRRVIDWGCGKGGTVQWLKSMFPEIEFLGYDPAHPEYRNMPKGPIDLVYSADVLEHVYPEDIEVTLAEIASLAPHVILIIDLTPAKKTLASGANAHVCLRSKEWWIQQCREHGQIRGSQLLEQPDKLFGVRQRIMIELASGVQEPTPETEEDELEWE